MMESDDQKNGAGWSTPPGIHYPAQDDFISLRQMLRMTLKHWKKIAVFTFVTAILSAVVFLAIPRNYGAETVLQVIMPEAVGDKPPDRLEHEANIASHLEYLRSSAVASLIVKVLAEQDIEISLPDLRNAVTIARPSRSNLIRITAEAETEEDALTIADTWRNEYLKLLSQNSFNRAILALQGLINTLQTEWLEKTGKAEEMRKYADESEKDKILTLSKGIEEGELGRRLIDGANAEQLKQLSEIQFKSQAFNEGYLVYREFLFEAEQDAGAAHRSLVFYKSVLDFLQQDGADASEEEPDPMVESYVKMLLEKRDIFAIGDAALIEVRRGAMKKTAIAVVLAFFAACSAAFMFEWLRDQA